MTEIESKVIVAWRQAAQELGIRFSSPFMGVRDGKSFRCLGFVHHFGGREGTLIAVIGQPSSKTRFQVDEDYHLTQLGSGYGVYRRDLFVDTLEDWGFFGPDSDRPSWFTGRYWQKE